MGAMRCTEVSSAYVRASTQSRGQPCQRACNQICMASRLILVWTPIFNSLKSLRGTARPPHVLNTSLSRLQDCMRSLSSGRQDCAMWDPFVKGRDLFENSGHDHDPPDVWYRLSQSWSPCPAQKLWRTLQGIHSSTSSLAKWSIVS